MSARVTLAAGILAGMAILGIMSSYLVPADEPRGPALRELFESITQPTEHGE